MGAAAQLDRERPRLVALAAHRDDPHLVAVFLAEERERSLGDGAVGGQQARAHRGVRPDALVDLGLDRLDVLCVNARGWLKSNRSRSGATSEPFCVTCSPETASQRFVQQVGDRMVGAQPAAAHRRRP